jgi:hypothetical protein
VAYFVVIGALLGSLFGLAHSAHQA